MQVQKCAVQACSTRKLSAPAPIQSVRPRSPTCIAKHAAYCNAAPSFLPGPSAGVGGYFSYIFLLIYLFPGPSAGVGGGSGNGKPEGVAGAAKFVEEMGAAASCDAHLKPAEATAATGVSLCLCVHMSLCVFVCSAFGVLCYGLGFRVGGNRHADCGGIFFCTIGY